MKHRSLLIILSIEAVVCLAVAALTGWLDAVSPAALPLALLGRGLRWLSLSGAAGNGVAIALYAAICLLPAGYLIHRGRQGRLRALDALLLGLSALLFAALYYMINPGLLGSAMVGGELALSWAVYSVLACYLIVSVVLRFRSGRGGQTLGQLSALLAVLCAVLVAGVFGTGFSGLLAAFGSLAAENTGRAGELGASYAFLVLQYLAGVLPSLLAVAQLLLGRQLLAALAAGPYTDRAVDAAQRLGRLCGRSVVAIAATQAGVNVAQVLLMGRIYSQQYTITIDLLPMALMLAVMLLAGYFRQGQALKEDSEMII